MSGPLDDLKSGSRNARGDWSPTEPLHIGPLLQLPWSPLTILKWLPKYLFPYNLPFFGMAVLIWLFLTPSRETLKTLDIGWIAFLLFRNAALIGVFFGAMELRLYVRRRQSNRFKYNGNFPADRPSEVFLFKSQVYDSVLRTFASGVPIWTGYEVLLLWAWANGLGPWTSFGDNPVWLAVFALMLPLFHEVHFWCVHRLIHVPILYKYVHSVHHKSVNPSPWSSLSMHPVEHLLYWSGSLVHLILPSHPVLMLFHLQLSGPGAIVGHVGFDKIELGQGRAINTHAYAHYLHHKYFEVNYGDGNLPLDKWAGTWHAGDAEGEARMRARFKKKKERMNALRKS
jgi:sterol desaturase/sphingolipid hydroxylase (fatty acid hydroxylase superfamily)